MLKTEYQAEIVQLKVGLIVGSEIDHTGAAVVFKDTEMAGLKAQLSVNSRKISAENILAERLAAGLRRRRHYRMLFTY